MPSLDGLTMMGQDALVLALLVSLPAVAIAALIGLVVAALQAATQIQDATISHLPRLLAVTLALILVGPWMGAHIAAFAVRAFQGG
ncbi:MAG: type III secretion system export apparatus subunit SctS [Myxococcota bacterium]